MLKYYHYSLIYQLEGHYFLKNNTRCFSRHLEYIFRFKPIIYYICHRIGGLAHLARALRWQRRGDRFESDILHITLKP